MSELKPCPFCGGEATFRLNCWGNYIVGCDDMSCHGWIFNDNAGYENKWKATKAWNTRYKPTIEKVK